MNKISYLISERISLRKQGRFYLIKHINRALTFEYTKEYIINNINKIIIGVASIVLIFFISLTFALEINTSIKYGKYNQKIYIPERQLAIIQYYKDSGNGKMTLTEALDLLALKSMECNREDGFCYNGYDIGPFQINRIHKKVFENSKMLMDLQLKELLFYYQMKYALGLIRSYMVRFCDWKRTKNNEARFKCIARAYNGHKIRKYIYAELAWRKREKIKEILFQFR